MGVEIKDVRVRRNGKHTDNTGTLGEAQEAYYLAAARREIAQRRLILLECCIRRVELRRLRRDEQVYGDVQAQSKKAQAERTLQQLEKGPRGESRKLPPQRQPQRASVKGKEAPEPRFKNQIKGAESLGSPKT